MIPYLRTLSPTGIKVFYATLSALVLLGGTFNFFESTFVHAQSNDQCAWLHSAHNDSVLIVRNILPGGVADEAGLQNGDTITRINNQTFSYASSQMLINAVKKGDYARYTIRRDSHEMIIPVRMIKVFNLFTVSLYFTGVFFLLVGLLTILSRPTGELQQRFMNYCLSNAFVFTLGTGLSLQYFNLPPLIATMIVFVTVMLLVLLLPQQVRFFFYFPRISAAASKKWLNVLLYGLSFILVCSNFLLRELPQSTSAMVSIFQKFSLTVTETLLFSFYPAGLGLLTQIYFSDLPKEQRKPVRPIIFAFFVSTCALIAFTVTVQSVPYAIFLRPELFLPMLLFVGTPIAIAYSIFRYGLMDVSIIIERSLIFAIATAVLAVIYFATVSVLSSTLSGYLASIFELSPNPNDYLWVTVIAFVVLGLVFDPVKRRTEDWVARIFYQERINYQKALLELSRELPGLITFAHIVQTLTTRLQSTMHLERVAILLNEERFVDVDRAEAVGMNGFAPFGHERETLFDELRRTKQCVYVEHHSVALSAQESDENALAERGVVLAVPLMVKHELIGVIAVGKKMSGRGFSREDLDLLMTVASQAAIAFENARLYESEIQKQKMDDSLAIARRIQQSLLPQHWPTIQGLDVHGSSIPAEIVGGDFYDLIEISASKLVVVVGDVSGKGISAALYMSKIQGMMQLAANRYESPRDMLIHINRYIHGSMERNAFVTMIVAVFDVDERCVRICRAGHTKPLLSQDTHVRFIESRGLGIGLCGTETFDKYLEEIQIPLEKDSTYVFYSDGLNEAINEKKEQFGTEAMQNIVRVFKSFPARTVLNNIEQSVHTFRGQAELFDDLTLVVVKTQ